MKSKLFLASLLILFLMPLPSGAVDLKLTTSTQYLWYNDIITNDDENDIAQYLRLSITDLDTAKKISVFGNARVSKRLSSDEDLSGRLYYLYIDYRDLVKDMLDIRLGRHFIYLSAGSGIIDGATLDFKKIGPLGVTLTGGRDVKFGEDSEVTGSGDYLVGISLYATVLKNTNLELSYMRRHDENDVSREIVGLNFSSYLLKPVSIYGETKFDVITEAINELLLGIKLLPLDRLIVKGEYYQSYPTFDATSIYSVFAVDKYKEAMIKAEYILSDRYRFSLGYAKEEFNDGEDADLYEAGIMASPLKNLILNATYDIRRGYGGELDGLRFNSEYTYGRTTLSAGIDYDDYRRDSISSETAKKYWIGAKHKLTKDISFSMRVEDNINVNYEHNYQGFIALNANL